MIKATFLVLMLITLHPGLAPAETLSVGVRQVPPFAMADVPNGWTGISVELWERVAAQLGWQTEWVEMDSAHDQVEGLAAGTIDVAVGALSMTPLLMAPLRRAAGPPREHLPRNRAD